MTTYKARDTVLAEDITDDLIGAEIEVAPVAGISARLVLADTLTQMSGDLHLVSSQGGVWLVHSGTQVTILTPPPVVQPEEPQASWSVVKIEGKEGWSAARVPLKGNACWWIVYNGRFEAQVTWTTIRRIAGDRQIIVSTAPGFPEDDPPVTISEWPADDEPLRDYVWEDVDGDLWAHLEGGWASKAPGGAEWAFVHEPHEYLPLIRKRRA